MKFFEVFKAGTYPQGVFTQAQIDELVENYDPQFCEAPVTLDHEQKGPAYGWVSKLKSENGKLKASFKNLSEELKTFVQAGKYKKISVEIYRNLEGKKPYLKAVSFLGASIPQVKGMQAVEFKEGEADIYMFEAEIDDNEDNQNNDSTVADEIKNLKDRIIELEKQIKNSKNSGGTADTINAFKEEIDSLKQELEETKKEVKNKEDLEQELGNIKATINEKVVNDFIDKQIENGILTPSNKDMVVSVFQELNNIKKFGEDSKVIDDFKSFIESLPKQVEFKEVVTKEKFTTKTKDADKFANADEESLEIFNEAKALSEKESIPFKEALLKLNI